MCLVRGPSPGPRHSPIYTVGCGHHPPFADEGATTDVLPVDLQAHLPGPLPRRRWPSTDYPCSSVATSWSRLVRGGAEGKLLLLYHQPSPQNLQNKALTPQIPGQVWVCLKASWGLGVSSQVSSVGWAHSAPPSHTQGPKILLYIRAPNPWVQASSLRRAVAQKLHLKWVGSMLETVALTDSGLKKSDLE